MTPVIGVSADEVMVVTVVVVMVVTVVVVMVVTVAVVRVVVVRFSHVYGNDRLHGRSFHVPTAPTILPEDSTQSSPWG